MVQAYCTDVCFSSCHMEERGERKRESGKKEIAYCLDVKDLLPVCNSILFS